MNSGTGVCTLSRYWILSDSLELSYKFTASVRVLPLRPSLSLKGERYPARSEKQYIRFGIFLLTEALERLMRQ